MLDVTYRMNVELVRWPAENFYGGKLRADESCAQRRLALLSRPQALEEILDPAKPLVFVQLDHVSAQKSSSEEARLVAEILAALGQSGLPLAEIAVVVPFRRQARRIKKAIRESGVISREEAAACVIDTVDRMQGQEREAIIVSMTASEPAYVEKLLLFLLQPQRLNVAVTRARSKVIVLASQEIARVDPVDPDAVEYSALWKSLCAASDVIAI